MRRIFSFAKKKEEERCSDIAIDCSGCDSEPDLGRIGCIRCLFDEIVRNDGCENISFVNGNNTVLSHDCIPLLNRAAFELCGNSYSFHGKRCAGCLLSQEVLDEKFWGDMSDECIDEIIEQLELTCVECSKAKECAEQAKDVFCRMKGTLSSILTEADVLASRVLGV